MGYYCIQCGNHVQIYTKKLSDQIKRENKGSCFTCFNKDFYSDIQRLLQEGNDRMVIRNYICSKYHRSLLSASMNIYYQRKKLEKEKGGNKNGNK